MRASYDDAAFDEAMDAAAWYETQQEGLLKRFLEKWKEAENRIITKPEVHRAFDGELRKCRFETFPYSLIYRVKDADTLQIVAVMHMSRRPGYWKDRLKS